MGIGGESEAKNRGVERGQGISSLHLKIEFKY